MDEDTSPSSKGRLAFWIHRKTVFVDDSADSFPQPEQGSSTAVETEDIDMGAIWNKDDLRARIRKNSSRLFSLLRFRASTVTSSRIDERSTLDTPANLSEPVRSTSVGSGLVPDGDTASTNQKDRSTDVSLPTGSCAVEDISRGVETAAVGQICDQPVDEISQSENVAYFTQDQVRLGLSAFLSGNLSVSTAPGQPTVIHRVHLRTRPNVQALQWFLPTRDMKIQGTSTNDCSDPPSALSGSGLSFHRNSTPLTSDDGSHLPATFGLPLRNGYNDKRVTSFDKKVEMTPSSAAVLGDVSPSIATVESVAAAKIFFELYFNSIYFNQNPRVQRLHELEEQLRSLNLPAGEQIQIKNVWIAQESEYLRECRMLKTRSNSLHFRDPASIAGYEVIKVLGKGSFGVVSLVREQNQIDEIMPSRLHVWKSSADGKNHHRRGKRQVYAMKAIRKSAMIRNCQEGHIRAERDCLVASANSRWLVQLISSFQDDRFLYLVLEYMVGGDFLSYLIRRDVLSGDETRHYIAEMILCVEEAHRLHWIHRDIKPDNFLIGASGHLKLGDFGLAFDGHWAHDQGYFDNHRWSMVKKLGVKVEGDAKDLKEGQEAEAILGLNSAAELDAKVSGGALDCLQPRKDLVGWRNRNQRRRFARSVVGTSQYMAPEVITGDLYDGRCDYWSIGIILYECFYGFTPFNSDDRRLTKLKIWQHRQNLYFPRAKPADKLVPADAIDLITRLLQDKEYRLSSRKYKFNDCFQPLAKKNFFYMINEQNRDYRGNFVFPDDAADIKVHPFFRNIQWAELHLQKPPFVPKVRNWKDTRFFDDGGYLDEVELKSTDSQAASTNIPTQDPPSRDPDEPQTANGLEVANLDDGPLALEIATSDQKPAPVPKKVENHQRKEKQRARDKILRDGAVGKTALKIRKRNAFLGYTYRRPRCPVSALGVARGRPSFTRARVTDIYSHYYHPA